MSWSSPAAGAVCVRAVCRNGKICCAPSVSPLGLVYGNSDYTLGSSLIRIEILRGIKPEVNPQLRTVRMSDPKWKLTDTMPVYDIDDAASLGEFFAKAIVDGSGQPDRPKKARYDRFRKIFWEDPLYNPEIKHGHINHAFAYLDKEQKEAWNKKGIKWSLSSDVRFRDNAYINPGPQKPERFPQCFEKPERHWGRERKINPYSRAKVYTRPNDRCKPWVKLVYLLY